MGSFSFLCHLRCQPINPGVPCAKALRQQVADSFLYGQSSFMSRPRQNKLLPALFNRRSADIIAARVSEKFQGRVKRIIQNTHFKRSARSFYGSPRCSRLSRMYKQSSDRIAGVFKNPAFRPLFPLRIGRILIVKMLSHTS